MYTVTVKENACECEIKRNENVILKVCANWVKMQTSDSALASAAKKEEVADRRWLCVGEERASSVTTIVVGSSVVVAVEAYTNTDGIQYTLYTVHKVLLRGLYMLF